MDYSCGGITNSFHVKLQPLSEFRDLFQEGIIQKIQYSNFFDEIESFNENSKDDWHHCAKTNRELYDTLLLDPLFMGNNCNMYLWLQIATIISIYRTKNGQFQNTVTFCNEKIIQKCLKSNWVLTF